jgi:hypothetical protein
MTNVVELDPELNRSVKYHARMDAACSWLMKMHLAGQLPPDVADAFNHLFHANSYCIAELIGCESLMGGDEIPL